MSNSRLIKIAYENPDLRPLILPIVTATAKTAESLAINGGTNIRAAMQEVFWAMMVKIQADIEDALGKDALVKPRISYSALGVMLEATLANGANDNQQGWLLVTLQYNLIDHKAEARLVANYPWMPPFSKDFRVPNWLDMTVNESSAKIGRILATQWLGPWMDDAQTAWDRNPVK